MTCAVCGCEFCWLCMKEISDLHYLSPSGCTFWGRSHGAGRRRFCGNWEHLSTTRYDKRYFQPQEEPGDVAGGVASSVIVSPVVAAVTVSIVPIMLASSMAWCPSLSVRSGGCGGLCWEWQGVRIEFDDENDMNVGSGALPTDHDISMADGEQPQYGVKAMLGLTPRQPGAVAAMDRLGPWDNLSETASTMALAGASITGSLSGSAMVNYLNRLEVQADVQKERCSLSGESGTVSLETEPPPSGPRSILLLTSSSSGQKEQGKLRKKGCGGTKSMRREDVMQLLGSAAPTPLSSTLLPGGLPQWLTPTPAIFSEFSYSRSRKHEASCSPAQWA
ncbi:E3 ubiquitin-protein ligase RNF19A-like isoform X2 [Lates japonicus]|uniref:E3 ubiquitin-protein ligase RNF19A-like isoform X2 n=1 Tax=Lates japonicus TaxID=270547 RepID=A0AAD3QWD2_LATJO|nr:E3 ubiquitin-protein ligase RNF19A-like isoform X2 [Lates japonicus]